MAEEGTPMQEQNTSPSVEQKQEKPPVSNSQPKIENIDVSKMSEEDPDVLPFNWGGEKDQYKHIDAKTQPIPEATKNQVNQPPVDNPASGKKFETGVRIFVEVLDWGMSELLAKISGKHTATAYVAEKESKSNLRDAIIMILEEAKAKIPTWMVLLFAFLACYGFQIKDAITERRNSQREKRPEEPHSLQPGKFMRDDVEYRRYKNGSEYPTKYNSSGQEIIIGQPVKRTLRKAA